MSNCDTEDLTRILASDLGSGHISYKAPQLQVSQQETRCPEPLVPGPVKKQEIPKSSGDSMSFDS